jgi:hypothetical protein
MGNALNSPLIRIWLMQIHLFKIFRTWGNQSRGALLQGPPAPALPPPSPQLALILCSLEVINETLKGLHSTNFEVEPPPFGVGNVEVSRDSEGEPPLGDITRELQKIKLLEFLGGRASERAKVWLERMTRFFPDYAST